MEKRPRILYVCTYNGTRAGIAEGFTKLYAGDRVEAFSSCFESRTIDEFPIAIMKEVGIDLESDPPVSIFSRAKKHEVFDYVITMCSTVSSELCSVFVSNIDAIYRGGAEVTHWSISKLGCAGTAEEKEVYARNVREMIRKEVLRLLDEIGIEISPPDEIDFPGNP